MQAHTGEPPSDVVDAIGPLVPVWQRCRCGSGQIRIAALAAPDICGYHIWWQGIRLSADLA